MRCATDDDCDIDAFCDEKNSCVKVSNIRIVHAPLSSLEMHKIPIPPLPRVSAEQMRTVLSSMWVLVTSMTVLPIVA